MERFLSRVVTSLATALAALILATVAICFLGVAADLALQSVVSAPVAALIVGAIGFAVAACSALIARSALRGRADVAPAPTISANDVNRMAATLGGIAARELGSRAQSHPYYAFVVALIAGLATGASPGLRQFVTGGWRR